MQVFDRKYPTICLALLDRPDAFFAQGEAMKIYKGLIFIFFFIFIPIYAYSQDYMEDNQQDTYSATTEENTIKTDTYAPAEVPQTEPVIRTHTIQKTQEAKQLKAKSVCIGDDCRSKWPVFKCATYDGRPAGETGDAFCAQMDKTCMDVYIGGGQNFFGECSVPASTIHKCRCCWTE